MSTPQVDGIENQRSALWLLGITLLGALSTTLVILGLATTDDGTQQLYLQDEWQTLIGLGGLVALFALYATKKQHELTRMQKKLHLLEVIEASLRARLGELSFLIDKSTQVQLQLAMQSMLELATQRLLACFEAHQSSIMLHNPDTGMLEVKAASGVDAELVAGSVVRPGEGIAGTVFSGGVPLILTPTVMESRFRSEIKQGRNIASSLCVPMRFRGTTIGIVSVSRTRGSEEFDPLHMSILESFAEHFAATITQAGNHQRRLQSIRKAA